MSSVGLRRLWEHQGLNFRLDSSHLLIVFMTCNSLAHTRVSFAGGASNIVSSIGNSSRHSTALTYIRSIWPLTLHIVHILFKYKSLTIVNKITQQVCLIYTYQVCTYVSVAILTTVCVCTYVCMYVWCYHTAHIK